MKEHKAQTLEELLKWWPELRKLTEHTKVIGIRIVAQNGTGAVAAFEFGETR